MNLSVKGPLLHIGEVEVVSDKFSKRVIVLDMSEDYNGQRYDNPVPFQLNQKKLDIANGFQMGQEVTVHFNMKGRKWEKDGKTIWFGTNEIWKMESNAPTQNNQQYQAPQAQHQYAPAPNNNTQHNTTANFNPSPEPIDDLPF